MKKLLKLFILIISLTIILSINVKAANAYISVRSSSQTVIVGQTFTTTVTISSSVPLGSWEYSLNYNPSLLKLESGSVYVADYGNGTLKSKTYTYKFKALSSGTTTIGVKSYAAYDWKETKMGLTSGTSSVKLLTLSQLQSTYSKNNYLSLLSVTGEKLNPIFDKNTLNYTVELKPNVESIIISAKAEDGRSRVEGTGTKTVTEGINKFEIVVTAQNGSIKKYTLNVNVQDSSPIEVTTTNNEKMTLVKRESLLKAPDGFIKNTININNIIIPSLYNQENQIVLVGLKDKDGSINLYIYDSTSKKYSSYIELTFNKIRILPLQLKKDNALFKRYEETKTKINNSDIETYKLSVDSKYSIFYGLDIEKGVQNYYKYDSEENSIIKFEQEEATLLNKELENKNKFNKILIITNIITASLLLTFILIKTIKNIKKENKILEDVVEEKKNSKKKQKLEK